MVEGSRPLVTRDPWSRQLPDLFRRRSSSYVEMYQILPLRYSNLTSASLEPCILQADVFGV